MLKKIKGKIKGDKKNGEKNGDRTSTQSFLSTDLASSNSNINTERAPASTSPTSIQEEKEQLPVLKELKELEPLPESALLLPQKEFDEVEADEKVELLTNKLRLCQIMFDFTPPPVPNKAKEVKRQQLMHLCDFIGTAKAVFTDQVMHELIKLVKVNIFRPLAPKVNIGLPEADEEEPVYCPEWEHLQIVYELLLRFVVSNDINPLRLQLYFNEQFLCRLLENFDSEDRREKDYLKTITHRMYARLVNMRPTIRKVIGNTLLRFQNDDTQFFSGVPELLEVLGTIVAGFSQPVAQEHIDFLKQILIPLHKSKYYGYFYRQLLYCEVQYIEKQQTLAEMVIAGLLRYWPISNTIKEMQFVGELEDVLELTDPVSFTKIMVPLFNTLARSIAKPHFQVQERILFLWHNEFVMGYIASNIDEILPILFPALYTSAMKHWNAGVHNLALNILKIFNEVDADVVAKVTKQYEDSRQGAAQKEKKRREQWELLEQAAVA